MQEINHILAFTGRSAAVMPGLVPGIHAVGQARDFQGWDGPAWMAGTSPAMTLESAKLRCQTSRIAK